MDSIIRMARGYSCSKSLKGTRVICSRRVFKIVSKSDSVIFVFFYQVFAMLEKFCLDVIGSIKYEVIIKNNFPGCGFL